MLKTRSTILFTFLLALGLPLTQGKAQTTENPERSGHASVECSDPFLPIECNLVINNGFGFTNSPKEAFYRGDVSNWQDVNTLTADINGALGQEMGWFTPALLNIGLDGFNFSSMLVDNLELTTEGISSNISSVRQGEKYAMSFFLSTSALTNYRSDGGVFTFKIVLANCHEPVRESMGNPEIESDFQVIYCKNFKGQGDQEWLQYFFTFEADADFDMIFIYPEVEEHTDAGTYIHFAYPELIPLKPQVIFKEIPGEECDQLILTACGVMNAQYLWTGPEVTFEDLNITQPNCDSEFPIESEFIFEISVPEAIGNNLIECENDNSPTLPILASNLIYRSGVDCTEPVILSGCNYMPNSLFTTNNVGQNPFNNGFVSNWQSCIGTPEVGNGIGPRYYQPAPLPAILSSINANFTGLLVRDNFNSQPPSIEGIAGQIAPLVPNQPYMLSIFVAYKNIDFAGADLNLNITLANCQNFDLFDQAILTIQGTSQTIFCENLPPSGPINQWRQFVFEFTPDEAFDMVIIYPEVIGNNQSVTQSLVYISNLEIIPRPTITITHVPESGSCNYILTATTDCEVTGSQFVWSNGLGTGQTAVVSSGFSATATLNFPLAELTPSNSCSSNNPEIIKTVAQLDLLNIEDAEISYRKYDPITNTSTLVTETLMPCQENKLCFISGEYLEITANSNFSSGNIWEARINPDFGNLDANANISFGSTNYTYNYNYSYPGGSAYFLVGLDDEINLGVFYADGNQHSFRIELRLRNSLYGESKTILVDVISTGGYPSQFWCFQISTFANYPHYAILGTNALGYTYQWDFPPGLNLLSPLTNLAIAWDDIGYNWGTSTTGPFATLTISNSFGCPSIEYTVDLNRNNCSMAKSNLIGRHDDENENKVKEEEVLIFPNPAKNELNLATKRKLRQVTIQSVEGKILVRKGGADKRINVTNLNKGYYLLKVEYEDGNFEVKPFIKN